MTRTITGQWNTYGPTTARKHSTPDRHTRPQSTTIDIHAHVVIPRAVELVKPHLDLSTVPLAHYANAETKQLNMKQEADIMQRRPLAQRLADMDAMGLDMQALMPPPPQCYYTVPLDIAVKATRMVNDGIAEYGAQKPDRFICFGSVPMSDAGEAVKELERCMTELEFKGVQILTNIAGQELSHPTFAPFWKRAEELGALVVIHPNGFTHGERFTRFYFNNIVGNPLETTLALHYLIFDGVLERHPELKLLAVHGGGYLGAYSGRIDHAWGARSDCHADLPHPPTTYLKRCYVDTVVFTPHQLAELVRVFGADRILMGTDYPFDMADYDPIGHVVGAELGEQIHRSHLRRQRQEASGHLLDAVLPNHLNLDAGPTRVWPAISGRGRRSVSPSRQLAHAPQRVETHLIDQIEHVEGDPILADQPLVVEIEIHDPHEDRPPARGQATEPAALVDGIHRWPAAGDRIGSIADPDVVAGTVTCARSCHLLKASLGTVKSDAKRQLMPIDEAIETARRADPRRAVPHHLRMPMVPLRHGDQSCPR